jgi:hypothetical protein
VAKTVALGKVRRQFLLHNFKQPSSHLRCQRTCAAATLKFSDLQALAHNTRSTFLDVALGHRKMPPGKRTSIEQRWPLRLLLSELHRPCRLRFVAGHGISPNSCNYVPGR